MLKIEGIHVAIQSVVALRGLTLTVADGTMVGLVGRNGAGKTSLMRAVMGHLPASGGSVSFDGADLGRLPRHARAALGIGYMPEDRGLVPELTVEENIMVPAWATNIADASSRLKRVFELLPEIARFAERKALALSGGQQKLVALGLVEIVLVRPLFNVSRALPVPMSRPDSWPAEDTGATFRATAHRRPPLTLSI
jgi:branched-chain amino acid transport system ATP-binding protein